MATLSGANIQQTGCGICLMKAKVPDPDKCRCTLCRVEAEFLLTFATAKSLGPCPTGSREALTVPCDTGYPGSGMKLAPEWYAELGVSICSQQGDPGLFSLAFYFRNGTVKPGEPYSSRPLPPPPRTVEGPRSSSWGGLL